MPLFNLLNLFVDEEARDGRNQMALDEVLLEDASSPVLRVYRWSEASVSFGYGQSHAMARNAFPRLPAVRRWTGGGIVAHQDDWTFSLSVPDLETFARVRATESYLAIHSAVWEALRAIGYGCRLGSESDCVGGAACFSAAVRDDVLAEDGRKLCGGAQRRTHSGLLHQGSIQHVQVPAGFVFRLGSLLARHTRFFEPDPTLLEKTRQLALEKYGSMQWLNRIP